jgi:hypothetical protein
MHRRDLVSRLAALLVGGALAGCSNNREVPVTAPERTGGDGGDTPVRTAAVGRTGAASGRTTVAGPVVREWGASAGPDGNLVVTVTVHNPAGSVRTGLVRVVAGVGDDQFTSRQFVSLDAGERATIELAFPVAYDRFDADPSLSFDVFPRTPRTPLPADDATAADG